VPSYDANRPWRHLYGRKWQRLSRRFLDKHPLCVRCAELGRVGAAAVVDHIKAHKGDAVLFWDVGNWQPLCEQHHNSWKQMLENAPAQCGADGYPSDGAW
jgi:5-methylcytosine-specific restriction protein A